MSSKWVLSFSTLSLLLSFPLFSEEAAADAASVEAETAAVEETQLPQSRRTVFPRSERPHAELINASEKKEEKQPSSKRKKPHFAGTRRPPDTKAKTASTKRKSRRVKNQWFSSKTQPKNDKKPVVQEEEDSFDELPEDRPHFIRANNLIAGAFATQSAPSNCSYFEETEGYNYPQTGFEAPNGHVFVSGEWLFWRTRQEGMEFATSAQIEFGFHSGFRVGLGAHLPAFDGWCVGVNYTYFNPERSHTAQGARYPLFLFEGAGSSGNTIAEAHGHWLIRFQSGDVQLGKSYYLTKTLVFSPFFGVRGAWIDQHARFEYLGGFIPAGQTFRTHFKNDFKGAGPLIGTAMIWELGEGLSLFGDCAAALIVGHFHVTQQQHQLNDQEVVHFDNGFNLVSPTVQMQVGIAWDRNFNDDQYHVGLSAGFETQYWWSQNQTEQFTDGARPIYMRQRGDLAFYGLTMRARFDF